MVTKIVSLLLLAVLCLTLHSAEGRASSANETEPSTVTEKAAPLASKDGSKVAGVGAVRVAGAGEHEEEEEELEETGDGPAQYPFRDLPADVLRDFPGLCFGSTALRLFQVGQSWSLTPFCGVATCLVGRDAYGNRFIERVQDCGPQPKRNPKCKNVNAKSQAQFPLCCPQFECEEGVELEYPTQEELQQLAHEAAQAAVRAQYDGLEQGQEEDEPVGLSGRKTPTEEPAEYDEPAVTEPAKVKPEAVVSEPAKEKPAAEAPKKTVPS